MKFTALTSALFTAVALGSAAPTAVAEPLVTSRPAGYQCDVPANVAGFRYRDGSTYKWHCLNRDGNPYNYDLSRPVQVDGCWLRDRYRLTFRYRNRVVRTCDWSFDFQHGFTTDVVHLAFVG